MFQQLTLRGGRGEILWGYRPAVTLQAWTIRKHEGRWTLTATVERADAFQSRQRPLLFSAPRLNGYWCWGVESLTLGAGRLTATLGPPER